MVCASDPAAREKSSTLPKTTRTDWPHAAAFASRSLDAGAIPFDGRDPFRVRACASEIEKSPTPAYRSTTLPQAALLEDRRRRDRRAGTGSPERTIRRDAEAVRTWHVHPSGRAWDR